MALGLEEHTVEGGGLQVTSSQLREVNQALQQGEAALCMALWHGTVRRWWRSQARSLIGL